MLSLASPCSGAHGDTTEMRFDLCMWSGEISSCSCLTVLPGAEVLKFDPLLNANILIFSRNIIKSGKC